ncbi:MAG: hypothetical protein JG764_2114 [Clostridiales bacterium]|jgi:hypothetical protein|nr:hypothetical protein [Clostridiales bacterium]
MMRNSEPRDMKEVHDIRKAIAEETKNLSTKERAELTNREGREIAEKYGLKIVQRV